MELNIETILAPIKNFACIETVHTCARTYHGAPRTRLCLRTTVVMTLFNLRAHVRKLTNPHTEPPFVTVTKGKS